MTVDDAAFTFYFVFTTKKKDLQNCKKEKKERKKNQLSLPFSSQTDMKHRYSLCLVMMNLLVDIFP